MDPDTPILAPLLGEMGKAGTQYQIVHQGANLMRLFSNPSCLSQCRRVEVGCYLIIVLSGEMNQWQVDSVDGPSALQRWVVNQRPLKIMDLTLYVYTIFY